jgi:hypothetical protein
MGLEAHQNDGNTRTDAIRAHVQFQAKGKPIEDWMTAAVMMRTHAVGRGHFYDMHAIDLVSLTATQGKPAGNEKLLKVMLSSIWLTAAYSTEHNRNVATYYRMQADKEAKIDQINAQLQQEITQTYVQMSENLARVGRQGFLEADQTLRGVHTFRNPQTGGRWS